MSPKIKSVKYIDGYKLALVFDNNEHKQLDLSAYFQYPVYHPLKDESFCKMVKVKDGIVQWNDAIDIDPDRIYSESTPVAV